MSSKNCLLFDHFSIKIVFLYYYVSILYILETNNLSIICLLNLTVLYTSIFLFVYNVIIKTEGFIYKYFICKGNRH